MRLLSVSKVKRKMNTKRFYVTTPIYYINSTPTVGSAYPTIAADVLARWNRLKQIDTFFLTGLDENSSKTVEAARERGYKDIQKYADDMAKKWASVWKKLNIFYDGFIRTTSEKHKRFAQKFFNKAYKSGDIYLGDYEGLYCNGCEEFKREIDLENGLCPYHKEKPLKIKEKNYFFKLTKYREVILNLIKKNKNFILPEYRQKEIVNLIKGGLTDISVSRPNLEWGIDVPFDKKQKIWVWYDALYNYKSGVDKKYWEGKVIHIVGKDIQKFHCIIWPAILLSAEETLPTTIFSHGFFTINGQKISKSLGNAIDPIYISDKYGVDALRYFLMREIPFGQDGDFSENALKNRLNNELANDLGNLVSRILTLVLKNNPLKKGKIDAKLSSKLNLEKINEYMDKLEIHNALNEIWRFINECNKHINMEKPWQMKNKKLQNHLYTLLESLRIISILLSSFIPETSKKINEQLNVKDGKLEDCKFGLIKKYNIKKKGILFRKIQS